MVRQVALGLLSLLAVLLPVLAVLAVRWARRRQSQIEQRLGRWTENEANVLRQQASRGGEWKRAVTLALLTPVAKSENEKSLRRALWLAIALLAVLSLLLIVAIVSAPKEHRQAAAASQHASWSVRVPEVRPNMSLNRSLYGMAPWPCDRLGSSSAARPGCHASAARLALR